MWTVLELMATSAPQLFLYVVGLFVVMILLSLLISLRRAEASERPEIIRALADLMAFWKKR
ncbi:MULTISPECIES: hypothetical protein [Streptomyces]|uniref:Uncharacterized protein n=1 Tax=Streptomyces nodosus TaxID=40318 RepID=A0A0B5DEI2_9ACTN|nr:MULTISPECIES: hypothetical protein [Streptomyces]AJE39585.1 hypothetical protein SNOD_05790 [Streptomyces nodosus]MBB4790542.1 hypothetical protein [Streptomyces nodosus]MYV45475.1 hypothetical protein [Streptomyces sp. SID2888]QEV38170.1 hypothetical protein CP978_06130 [Streptomyces nodosus]